MVRRTRSATNRSRRFRRRRNTRGSNGRRIAGRVFNNAPTIGRMPRDPPQLTQTAERHYRVRVNFIYDKDSTSDVLLLGNTNIGNITGVMARISDNSASMSWSITRGMFFRMHGVRFGATDGVSIALQSVCFWGPIPTKLECVCSLRSVMGATAGRPPQVAVDRSSGLHRAATKLVSPQLFWYTNESASNNPEVVLVWDMGQSDTWDHGSDFDLGVADLSFVARAAP